jgi:hypothetical protein
MTNNQNSFVNRSVSTLKGLGQRGFASYTNATRRIENPNVRLLVNVLAALVVVFVVFQVLGLLWGVFKALVPLALIAVVVYVVYKVLANRTEPPTTA